MNFQASQNKYKDRQYVLAFVIVLVAIIFSVRLFYLQIIDNQAKISAENSSTRKVTIYPDRGLILDRNGKLLAFNEVAYDLMVTPAQLAEFDTTRLLQLLSIDEKELEKKIQRAKRYSYRVPSIIAKQLSAETYAIMQEIMHKFPGFHVQTRTLRKYPKPIAAHVLGYVGEVNDRVVNANPYYNSGDYIGISGIERSYEEFLRGQKGTEYYLVDKFNRIIEPYKDGALDEAAKVGANITTTLDRTLQEYGELLMQNKIGSVVAIEPSSGEILALVSSPSYDPNLLVGRVRGKNYRMLANSKLKPLFNRALMAQYPPGSTFKLINGLVALQDSVITPKSTYTCRHGYVVPGFRMGCHHSHSMALVEAVQRSCNAYFGHYYRKILDQERFESIGSAYTHWRNHLQTFGIGRKLGSDLQGELTGLVPKADYFHKKEGYNKWKSLWLISMGIGQGELLLTPFQMANMTSAIANRGYFITPHIVKHIEGKDTIARKFSLRNYTSVDPRHFEPIIDGMELVVQAGTATAAKIPDIAVCGKTGTAQNPHGKDHSIFTAFAPKENPKIAISVYVENSGFGSTWAAPIASLMIEKYLTDSISPKRKWVEKRMMKGDLIPEFYKAKADTTKTKDPKRR